MADAIPAWQFKASCPHCGAELSIKRDVERFPVEFKGDERLFCAVHGDVMNLEEARRVAFEENRDNIINKARDFARESLRRAFKNLK